MNTEKCWPKVGERVSLVIPHAMSIHGTVVDYVSASGDDMIVLEESESNVYMLRWSVLCHKVVAIMRRVKKEDGVGGDQ